MTSITIALLCFFMKQSTHTESSQVAISAQHQSLHHGMVEIDSLDVIIFNLDQAIIDGDIIEVPVFVSSDEQINALDFSMLMDTLNLDYVSVVEHVAEIQYAAFRASDSKFRFTSNSFSPYPMVPQKVISVRFKSLKGVVTRNDFLMQTGYLNGESCSFELQMQGDEIFVSNKEIETSDLFISPNPATDYIYVESDEEGTLDMFDLNGKAVISSYRLINNDINSIDVQSFPRGTYTVRIIGKDHTMKTQKMLLQ